MSDEKKRSEVYGSVYGDVPDAMKWTSAHTKQPPAEKPADEEKATDGDKTK